MTVDRETIAYHEAGHAVMRWALGYSPTAIRFTSDGGGFCDGCGMPMRASDALLVHLAGFAVESGYMAEAVDLSASDSSDFGHARDLLSQNEWLRIVVRDGVAVVESVDEALRRAFGKVCERLLQFSHVVDVIAEALLDNGEALDAHEIKALIDDSTPLEVDRLTCDTDRAPPQAPCR